MFLDEIVNKKKFQIEEEKKSLPLKEVLNDIEKFQYKNQSIKDLVEENKILKENRQKNSEFVEKNIKKLDFKSALISKEISIIGEIKKASPSKGVILENFDLMRISEIYEKLSIDAISVLTEKYFFKGNDDYLKRVKGVTEKPILRKDFIVDIYQIYTSKLIGADSILLIGAVLKNNLKNFYLKAKELELQCIIEVHNEEELFNALEVDGDIIGINNRNLMDFSVNLNTTEKLIKHIPKEKIVVSESGIRTPEDVRLLKQMGVNAVLIGECFMRKLNNIDEIESFILKAKNI